MARRSSRGARRSSAEGHDGGREAVAESDGAAETFPAPQLSLNVLDHLPSALWLGGGGIACWCVIITAVLRGMSSQASHLPTAEKQAAEIAASMLTTACLLRAITTLASASNSVHSVITIPIMAVQAIAASSNWVMATMAVPAPVDPITGCHVQLVRYGEWFCCTFIMAFVIEAIDNDASTFPVYLGLSQSVCILFGLALPYAPGPVSWAVLLALSCIFFGAVHMRLYVRRRQLFAQREPTSVLERLALDRKKLACRLLMTCCVTWTVVLVEYGVAWADHELHFFSRYYPHWHFVVETALDVVAKLMYTNIVADLQLAAPEHAERWQEQSLRVMMNIAWEHCGDVIVVSQPRPGGWLHTSASPSLSGLLGAVQSQPWVTGQTHKRLKFAQEAGEAANAGERAASGAAAAAARAGAPASAGGAARPAASCSPAASDDETSSPSPSSRLSLDNPTPLSNELPPLPADEDGDALEHAFGMLAFDQLVSLAWRYVRMRSDGCARIVCTLRSASDAAVAAAVAAAHAAAAAPAADGEDVSSAGATTPGRLGLEKRCEIDVKLVRDTPVGDSLVIIARDISDRIERLEMERSLFEAAVSRQKDEEANRFNRHEVKNGVLAALSACDHLREVREAGLRSELVSERAEYTSNFNRSLVDLSDSLHSTLNTVLAEAMARDVVHGTYRPQLEGIQLEELLGSRRTRRDTRFRFMTEPRPLPLLELDPRLVFHIYRNAVSNATKYGRPGGVITTEVEFASETLTLRVINEPGPDHEALLKVDATRVFAKGTRLHGGLSSDSNWSSTSAGDGAWIMRKCAEALAGVCAIQFLAEYTVFELRCPARKYVADVQLEGFHLPEDVHGIAIDDSRVQRMLLTKMLQVLGVPRERTVVLGSTSDEITCVHEYIVDAVRAAPPGVRFIVMADENLDYDAGGGVITHSGSAALARARKALRPEEEARTLMLVRSANDSPEDIEKYHTCAHGVVPKGPFSRTAVLKAIVPAWVQRFGAPDHKPAEAQAPADACSRSTSRDMSSSAVDDEIVEALRQLLSGVDAMLEEWNHVVPEESWPLMWVQLHRIKGEVLSLTKGKGHSTLSGELTDVVSSIEAMRNLTRAPADLAARWALIKRAIGAHIHLRMMSRLSEPRTAPSSPEVSDRRLLLSRNHRRRTAESPSSESPSWNRELEGNPLLRAGSARSKATDDAE